MIDILTENERKILFLKKKNYEFDGEKSKHDEFTKFYKILQKVIDHESNSHNVNFSKIRFPHFDYGFLILKKHQSISFNQAIFDQTVTIKHTTLINSLDFNSAKFKGTVNCSNTTFNNISFKEAVFRDEVKFIDSTFIGNANFSEISFEADTYFKSSTFKNHVTFENSECAGIFDFSNVTFTSLLLDKSNFLHVSFLKLFGWNQKGILVEQLDKHHFETKETARIIKACFENQNNITEANKYFRIEQDLYIDELKKDIKEPNRLSNLTVLHLNKWVSNFGTDWIKSLLLLFTLSYLFMRFYIDFDSFLGVDKNIKHFTEIADIQYIWTMFVSWGLIYLSTFNKSNKLIFWSLILIGVVISIIGITSYDNVLAMQNYIIQLTNPINAFKNMNLYEGIEIYGAFVRIIIVTIIYQFLVAFRQNTRRK